MIRTWFILTMLLVGVKSSEVQTGSTGLKNVLCRLCETLLSVLKTDEKARNELKTRIENACINFQVLAKVCPSISGKFISETVKMLQANEPKDICKSFTLC
ncbi:hypothetical protein T265_00629 [Opisthorchis viverrini]|uniref:Saposin B-type domain-containing protein n=1 Tax=Opisthorchis viverrini TaxID=6198 RepID=A0A075ACA5_OPIVI|nr:hypothetical protein T265_00629 [Opisthorchis viverrini]KER33515.1 hypothetical protein T265_00629 [Opisthorchis viverrini]